MGEGIVPPCKRWLEIGHVLLWHALSTGTGRKNEYLDPPTVYVELSKGLESCSSTRPSHAAHTWCTDLATPGSSHLAHLSRSYASFLVHVQRQERKLQLSKEKRYLNELWDKTDVNQKNLKLTFLMLMNPKAVCRVHIIVHWSVMVSTGSLCSLNRTPWPRSSLTLTLHTSSSCTYHKRLSLTGTPDRIRSTLSLQTF